jgi:hypothetical protein
VGTDAAVKCAGTSARPVGSLRLHVAPIFRASEKGRDGRLWHVPLAAHDPIAALAAHSALMPASLMIGQLLSASAFTSAPSASGVCRSRGKTSNPSSMRRERTPSLARALTTAALSLPIISVGVPLGAKNPSHAGQEERVGNPSSRKVGMSRASAKRAHQRQSIRCVEQKVDLTAHQVLPRRRKATIGHEDQLRPGFFLKERA